MKSFFQEYGGTIIASLVVVCLIAVCTVIKPLAAESHVSIVDKLSNYVEETLDNASKNDLNSVSNRSLAGAMIVVTEESWPEGQKLSAEEAQVVYGDSYDPTNDDEYYLEKFGVLDTLCTRASEDISYCIVNDGISVEAEAVLQKYAARIYEAGTYSYFLVGDDVVPRVFDYEEVKGMTYSEFADKYNLGTLYASESEARGHNGVYFLMNGVSASDIIPSGKLDIGYRI